MITLLPILLILIITIGACCARLAHPEHISDYRTCFSAKFGNPTMVSSGSCRLFLGRFGSRWSGWFYAVPPCLLASIYLAEYAHTRTRTVDQTDSGCACRHPACGLWRMGIACHCPFVDDVLAPSLRPLAWIPFRSSAVTQPTGFGILAGGIVLAVMIAPLIISVTFEVFSTVPNDLRHASLAVGATQWQTIRNIVLPQVMPGIIAADRAGGIARVRRDHRRADGGRATSRKMPTSIFDSAYPLPALIANNYGEMMSIPLYDAALLGAALVLLVVILIFNILSTLVLQRFLRRKWA
ncbi:MAG: ABC transporter permease subunit [Desulfosudis oleivorans]|nr:ABC transporter permease subunit [Desulfosudis oleivorans]